jgi:hypothetical protein
MRTRALVSALVAVFAVSFGIGPAQSMAGDNGVPVRLSNRLSDEAALSLFIDDEPTPRCVAAWHETCDSVVSVGEHQVMFKRVSDGNICKDMDAVWFWKGASALFEEDGTCALPTGESTIAVLRNTIGKKVTLLFFVDREPTPRCEVPFGGFCETTLACGARRLIAKKAGESKRCATLTLPEPCRFSGATTLRIKGGSVVLAQGENQKPGTLDIAIDACGSTITVTSPPAVGAPAEFAMKPIKLINGTTEGMALFIDKETEPRCIATPSGDCTTDVTLYEKRHVVYETESGDSTVLLEHELIVRRVGDGRNCATLHHRTIALATELRVTECSGKGVKEGTTASQGMGK